MGLSGPIYQLRRAPGMTFVGALRSPGRRDAGSPFILLQLAQQHAHGRRQCCFERVVAREPQDPVIRRAAATTARDALRLDRQPKMREGVLDRRERVAKGDARRKRARQCATASASTRHFGQAPQSAPDAKRRTLLEQDRPGALDHEHANARCGNSFFGRGDGSSRDAIRDARHAIARTGHSAQRGVVRVHSVAPRSIIACV